MDLFVINAAVNIVRHIWSSNFTSLQLGGFCGEGG